MGRAELCQAEIEEFDIAMTGYEDVGRLDVAMNDSFGVSSLQSGNDLAGKVEKLQLPAIRVFT